MMCLFFFFFRVPCNGATATARYYNTADGPVARVTGSGQQRYTPPRVGGSGRRSLSSRWVLFLSLLVVVDRWPKRHRNANGQHPLCARPDRRSVPGGDCTVCLKKKKKNPILTNSRCLPKSRLSVVLAVPLSKKKNIILYRYVILFFFFYISILPGTDMLNDETRGLVDCYRIQHRRTRRRFTRVF